MAVPSIAVRKTAKAALRNNWLQGCFAATAFLCAVTLSVFVSSLLSSVTAPLVADTIFALFIIFLLSPLFLGLVRFFKNIILFENVTDISQIFIYFSSLRAYKRILKFILEIVARLLLYTAVSFAPAGVLKLITSDFLYDIFDFNIPLWSESLDTLLSFLLGMAALVTLILMLRFYLAPFLITADDDMSPDEAIHMSSVISRGSLNEFWALGFSLFGYFLLTVFMIPLIFTVPYFLCCYAVHARFAVSSYNINACGQNKTKTF